VPARTDKPWSSRAAVRFVAFFLVASALAYGLEHLAEHAAARGAEHTDFQAHVFNIRAVYQRLVSSFPRRLVPRYTVLVNIDPENDPLSVSLHDLCRQRPFIAQLVAALEERRTAVIVLDKYFGAKGCPDKPDAAIALREGVTKATSRVPVVVGLYIDKGEPRIASGHLVWEVMPPLEFEPDITLDERRVGYNKPADSKVPERQVGEGIVNIDPDPRRLALGWYVSRATSSGEWRNALALEAAQRYDTRLLNKYPRLEELVRKEENPYLSLIAREEFVEFQAGDVLCAWSALSADARCAVRKPPSIDPAYLRGRIVIVGETHSTIDRHSTVIGNDIPGYILQANYVEALLDERYFEPVAWWVDYLVGFLFFLAIEASLRQRSAFRCIAGVLGIIAITFVLLSLTVRYLGYYLNPVTVSAFVLGLKLIAWLTERIARKGESDHEA
jgi:CHASE2 domain-containing sensor protein